MALGSTQPLTQISTSDTSSGVKEAVLTGAKLTYRLHVPTVCKYDSLKLLEP